MENKNESYEDNTPETITVANIIKRIHNDETLFTLIHPDLLTPYLCLKIVTHNGLILRYITDQTPEICLEAVKENGNALKYVKNQTPEICLQAVEHGAVKPLNM